MSLVDLFRATLNLLSDHTEGRTQKLAETAIIISAVKCNGARRVASPPVAAGASGSPEVGNLCNFRISPSRHDIQVLSLRQVGIVLTVAVNGCRPSVYVGVVVRAVRENLLSGCPIF